ncbi:hypothetical protein AAFC00_005647 [Neodothiora populina]|uniref:Uncharacterized protein n=1 Tax=Neodothiora populina TaxID=2781224 RepID=A0ABR3PLI4_9PEZI
MLYTNVAAIVSLLSIPLASAKPRGNTSSKRDLELTWGPLVGMGPTRDGVGIISAVSTIYPGNMPKTQPGGLYNWIGIDSPDANSDLVQGIVGSYTHGQSECPGAEADSLWCITAEVYGTIPGTQQTNQWVGDLRALDKNPADGITFNYTLVNQKTGLWLQTVTNARTQELMATFNKTSQTMTLFNTAVECQNGCTPPVDPQYWVDTTIILSEADEDFGSTLYQSNHATNTPVTTPDNGKTWKIANITIPVVPPVA